MSRAKLMKLQGRAVELGQHKLYIPAVNKLGDSCPRNKHNYMIRPDRHQRVKPMQGVHYKDQPSCSDIIIIMIMIATTNPTNSSGFSGNYWSATTLNRPKVGRRGKG
jgi:hypothetical protein